MNVKRDLDNFPSMAKKKFDMDYSKQVVPVSGGIVSTVLLYNLVATDYNVLPLAFDWGEMALRQNIECVKRTCKKLNLDLKVAEFNNLGKLLEEGMNDPLVMSNRDLIYLGVSLSYALSKKAATLHYPIYMVKPEHADAIGNYAMFLRNIVEGSDRAGGMGGGRVQLAFNFWQNQEFEVIELGDILNVPFNDTWSCGLNGKIHCGKCLGCLNRKESFKKTSVKDPTEYEV